MTKSYFKMMGLVAWVAEIVAHGWFASQAGHHKNYAVLLLLVASLIIQIPGFILVAVRVEPSHKEG